VTRPGGSLRRGFSFGARRATEPHFDISRNIVDAAGSSCYRSGQRFDFSGNISMAKHRMNHPQAVRALGALAHDTRLQVHRLLVRAGDNGLSAGTIARKLDLPASSLSFHLAHLQSAGVITQRRVGRSLIYAIDFDSVNGLMAYLQENCCRGFAEDGCAVAAPTAGGAEIDERRPARRVAGAGKRSRA